MAIDSSSPTQRHFEPEEEITTTVSVAVSEATNTEVLDVPPLYEFVDADSVIRLFDSGGSDGENGARILEFRILECCVRIDSDEQAVTVLPDEGVVRPEFHGNVRVQTHNWGGKDDFYVDLIEAARPTREDTKGYLTLSSTIDLDCLSRLFRPVTDDVPRDSGWFSFTLGERTVIVEARGRITSTNSSRAPNIMRVS